MRIGIVVFIIVVLGLIGAYFFFDSPKGEEVMRQVDSSSEGDNTNEPTDQTDQSGADQPDDQSGETSTPAESDLMPVGGGLKGEDIEAAAVIRRTESGYEPREVTIQQGQTVSFVNEIGRAHWPASDVHPTHQIYSAFDPQEPIDPGETWSFVFDQAGDWAFHDHLRANLKGVVHVLPQEQN